MDDLDDLTRLPDDFDGRVRLFPLPDLVLFPHAMQPLHIFEPRYCEMLNEALSGDHLIAMSTLTGGLASTADSDPPIASTVCLGKIVSHAEVENERHNVLLVGTRRARIATELDAGRAFRMAAVEVPENCGPESWEPRLESRCILRCGPGRACWAEASGPQAESQVAGSGWERRHPTPPPRKQATRHGGQGYSCWDSADLSKKAQSANPCPDVAISLDPKATWSILVRDGGSG